MHSQLEDTSRKKRKTTKSVSVGTRYYTNAWRRRLAQTVLFILLQLNSIHFSAAACSSFLHVDVYCFISTGPRPKRFIEKRCKLLFLLFRDNSDDRRFVNGYLSGDGKAPGFSCIVMSTTVATLIGKNINFTIKSTSTYFHHFLIIPQGNFISKNMFR